MCADLIDLGADPVSSFEHVYNTSPASRLLLMRESMNSLEWHASNRFALQAVTQAHLKLTGSIEEDVDGFVQLPFQVSGVVLSVFLLELQHGWKISCRSKGEVSAAKLAQAFGGNGHFHAAGARIAEALSLEEIKSKVVTVAKTLF
jgi:phosphoesterase RecJ-like protein